MGQRLIKQDNGCFAIWSDIVDDVIIYNATAEDIVEFCVEEASRDVRRRAERWVQGKEPGRSIYTPEHELHAMESFIRDMKADGEDTTLWEEKLAKTRRRLAGEVVEDGEENPEPRAKSEGAE